MLKYLIKICHFAILPFCHFAIIIFISLPLTTYSQKNEIVFINLDTLDKQITHVIINDIQYTGLKITRPRIVDAELNFKTGDTIRIEKLYPLLERNKERVSNLAIFVYTDVLVYRQDDTTISDTQSGIVNITVEFKVQERWYIWPVPIVEIDERNFNVWWEKKNFERLDYGVNLVVENFRGRKEYLKFKVQHGFNRKYEIKYEVPNLNRKQNIGMAFEIARYLSHTVEYNTLYDDKLVYKNSEEFPIKKFRIGPTFYFRHTLNQKYSVKATYRNNVISDSTFKLNPDFYLKHKNNEFVQLEFEHEFNLRDANPFPLKGFYSDIYNITALPFPNKGEPFSQFNLYMAKYWELSNKYYYQSSIRGQALLTPKVNQADNFALGYASFVRGYELYVMDGQHFVLFKQAIMKALVQNKIYHSNLFKTKKFNDVPLSCYFSLFTDAAYVFENQYGFIGGINQNKLNNKLLLGGGVGFYVVSYYDLVYRFEYSVNDLGQHGFFIHLGKGI